MAIDPVTTDPVAMPQGVNPAGAPGEGLPAAVPFEEVLAKAAAQQSLTASTAAEILRLKLLNSTLGLGGNDERRGGGALAVQTLLERFLEQLPKEEVGGAGAAQESGGQEEVCTALEEPFTPVPLSTESIIEKASRRYGVDSGLIKAIIKAESDFNPRAVSSAGAQGLMQLMPATARGLGVRDPFDPEQNVMAGTRFLKDMLQRYGNVDEALAAYNWGPGNVDRHGVETLPRETKTYLGKVKAYYSHYSA